MIKQVLYMIAIVTVWFSVLALGSAAVGKQQNSNSLGVPMYQENPNAYLMGFVSDANIGETRSGRKVVVLEIRPTNTYSTFSQSIAFCSVTEEQIDKLRDGAVVVLTYSKVMHRPDCYDLYRVDKVGK